MGDFVKANTPLPAPKTDANPPQGLPSELDAADINNINSALGDLRTHASGWVNLKTYGAVCDGVTDDYPALSAMVAALGTTPATVIVPSTTRVNTNITIPATLPVRLEGGAAFTGSGAVTYTSWSPALIDTAGKTVPVIQIDHYGATVNASYGINIFNRADNGAAPTAETGAATAIVVHNYSDSSPAVQLDSTRSKPFITMKNATNPVNSAGTQGTSPYFDFWGYTTGSPVDNLLIGELNRFLAFVSFDSSRPWTFQSNTTGPSLQVTQPNAGVGLNITQTGNGSSVAISHAGATHGVTITPQVGADGFFPLLISGRTNGIGVTTSQNGAGQNVGQFTKNGTGAGDCLILVNKGTGKGVNLSDGTNNLWWLDNVGKMNVRIGGTADTAGKAVLVAGTVTVATTAVTANSIIMLSRQVAGGTVGVPQIGVITAGTSFRIDSVQPGTASTVQAADTSTIAWRIIN